MYTISIQEYLQAIYRLERVHTPVSTTELATHLGVAPASISGMTRRLDRQGLVEHEPYRGVTLTPKGREEALRLIRVHRLWELFLHEVLGVAWDEVHAEAHRLEHATSDQLADRLAEYLGQPETDPHGQPIPTRQGVLSSRTSVPLAQVDEGQTVTLEEVPDGDPELLCYLGDLGLFPGTDIRVVAIAPFSGPITLRVGDKKQIVGQQLAAQLLVTHTHANRCQPIRVREARNEQRTTDTLSDRASLVGRRLRREPGRTKPGPERAPDTGSDHHRHDHRRR